MNLFQEALGLRDGESECSGQPPQLDHVRAYPACLDSGHVRLIQPCPSRELCLRPPATLSLQGEFEHRRPRRCACACAWITWVVVRRRERGLTRLSEGAKVCRILD